MGASRSRSDGGQDRVLEADGRYDRRDGVSDEGGVRGRRLKMQREVLAAVNDESDEALVRLNRLAMDSRTEMAASYQDMSAPAFLGLAAMGKGSRKRVWVTWFLVR